MKFLKALRSSDGGIGDSRLQSILTTHSPNLASKAPLDSLIIMEGGKGFALRRGETGLDPDDYKFLEKFLDVTKSNLFFAKAVLIVEGDGENILIPAIAELLGTPLEDYGVSIVNVGSRALGRFAKIFRRAGLDGAEPNQWLGTKVVCLVDLDLWPEKAKKSDTNLLGYKEWKEKNRHYWVAHYTTPAALQTRNDARRSAAGQNVRVELSDVWTFEYALICSGLATEVAEAMGMSPEEIAALPADVEERAITLYQEIETSSGAKTELALTLAERLTTKFGPKRTAPPAQETAEAAAMRLAADMAETVARRTQLRAALPGYVKRALDHVTSSTPVAVVGGAAQGAAA